MTEGKKSKKKLKALGTTCLFFTRSFSFLLWTPCFCPRSFDDYSRFCSSSRTLDGTHLHNTKPRAPVGHGSHDGMPQLVRLVLAPFRWIQKVQWEFRCRCAKCILLLEDGQLSGIRFVNNFKLFRVVEETQVLSGNHKKLQ